MLRARRRSPLRVQPVRAAQRVLATPWIRRASRARGAGDWPGAADAFAAALRYCPRSPKVWVQYGHALKELGDLHSAEVAYRRAAEIEPDHADALLHLAGVLTLLGRPAEAARSYRRVLDLGGGSADLREALERAELSARPDPTPASRWGTLDPVWQNALEAALPHLRQGDRLLLPEGGWPGLPWPARRYSYVLELGDATTILLPKDRISGLAKHEAERLLQTWQCLHADRVFLVFATRRPGAPEMRDGPERYHVEPLETYVGSRALKTRRGTVYFLHLPKAGGTSLWSVLASAFRSNLLYSSRDAFLANPPAPGEYDAVSVHGAFAELEPLLTPEDLVVVLMREPTRRFESVVMHSRRASVDPLTLTPVMSALRSGAVASFLGGAQARSEALMQLICLGEDRRVDAMTASPDAWLANALAVIRRPDVIAAPTDEMPRLIALLAARLGFPKRPPPSLNASDAVERAANSAELEAARLRLEAVNAPERALFEEVSRRFAAVVGADGRRSRTTGVT